MVMKSPIFWDITLCRQLKVNRRFGRKFRLLATDFMLISCLACSSRLKMEMVCPSETLVDFQRTTERYTPADTTLQINLNMPLSSQLPNRDLPQDSKTTIAVLNCLSLFNRPTLSDRYKL
jgi:hypothetical protein